ncbi:MAG: hypothetical protein ACYS8I_06710 [Planctomycetota bacterium]|jgi:hypothetical protein
MKRFKILCETFQNPISPTDSFIQGLIYNARDERSLAYAEQLVSEGKAEWRPEEARMSGSGIIRDPEE